MDTTQPPAIETLIDEFVRGYLFLPEEAALVRDPGELCLRLQERIRNVPRDLTWRAWSDGFRVWLIIARRVYEQHAGEQRLILEMSFHDQDGVCAGSGAWARGSNGKWWLYRVPAESFAGETRMPVSSAARS